MSALLAASFLLPCAAHADPTGVSGPVAFSSAIAGSSALADGLIYEGGDNGRPAVVSGPVSDRPAGPSIEAAATIGQAMRAWFKGYGFGSRTGSDAFGTGFTVRGGGAAAGVERLVTPSVLLGLAIGGSTSRTDGAFVRSDADTVSAAVYGRWFSGPWEANALAGINYTRFDNARTLTVAGTPVATQGDTDAPGFNLAADLGYRIPLSATADLKPFAGLQYAETHRRAYQENVVGGPGSLTFPDQAFRRFASLVGADIGFTTVIDGLSVRPEVRLGWVHDFIDPAPLVTATFASPLVTAPFVTRDPQPGRDGLVVGAQLTVWKVQGVQAYASYAGEFRSNSDAHLGTLGVRLSW